MKKKYIVLLLSCGIVGATAVGATLAANTDDGLSFKQTISEKTLGVTDNNTIEDEIVVIPGGDTRVSYYVKNDAGVKNGTASEHGSYDIYAKVFVYFDWTQDMDSKESYGEIGFEDDYLRLYIGDVEIPKNISSYSQQKLIGDWIVAYSDNEQMVLYYTKPLAQDEESSEFLSKIAFDSRMDNKYAKASLDIETEVQVVQADSADAAIAAEWGVFPSFDTNSDGIKIITSVNEVK